MARHDCHFLQSSYHAHTGKYIPKLGDILNFAGDVLHLIHLIDFLGLIRIIDTPSSYIRGVVPLA